jgi:hypothetical protein
MLRLSIIAGWLIALSIPAAGQDVVLSELEGARINANVHLNQVLRRDGRTGSVKLHQTWQLSVGAGKTIEVAQTAIFHGPRGTRKAQPISGTVALDEIRPVRSRGGGEGLWTFAYGVLTFVRTLQSGAFRITFEFARGSGGITCAATATFAREQSGSGPIRLESPFGGQVTIISSKQQSSNCRISKI